MRETGISVSRIWHVIPQIRKDRRKDRVEPSHEQLSSCIGIADKLTQLTGVDTKIVGWYHSHPNITVQPSHVDLRTQAQHQALDEGFVGLIFSCFNKDQKLHCTAFQSVQGAIETDCPAIMIEDEDPDMREALKLSLEDSQKNAHASTSNWKHKEVPIVVSKELGAWEHGLGDIVNLQEMLLIEEKSAYESAAKSDVSTPLSHLQYSAMYLQSLSKVMNMVMLPSVRMLRQTVAQNMLQAEQLTAQLELLKARKLSLLDRPTNNNSLLEGRLGRQGSLGRFSSEEKQDRISEAEYLISIGKSQGQNHSRQSETIAIPVGSNRSRDAEDMVSSKGHPPPGFLPLQGGLTGGSTEKITDPRINQLFLSDRDTRMSASDKPIGKTMVSHGASAEDSANPISHRISQGGQLLDSVPVRGQPQRSDPSTSFETSHSTSAIQFGSIRSSFSGQGISSVDQQKLPAPSVSNVMRQQHSMQPQGERTNTAQFSRQEARSSQLSTKQVKPDRSGEGTKSHISPFIDVDPIALMNRGKVAALGTKSRLRGTQQQATGSDSQKHNKPHNQNISTSGLAVQQSQGGGTSSSEKRQSGSVSTSTGTVGNVGNDHNRERHELGSFSSGTGSGKHLKRQGSRGSGSQHGQYYHRNRKNEGGTPGKPRTKSRDFDDRDHKRKG